MAIVHELAKLIDSRRTMTVTLPWPWEIERWTELLVALLYYQDPSLATGCRDLANALTAQVPDVESWSAMKPGSPEHAQAFNLFASHGWKPGKATRAIDTVRRFAERLLRKHSGHLQRLARKHFERLHGELATELRRSGVDAKKAGAAARLWLQNSFSAPILLENAALRDFRRKHRSSTSQLIAAADDVGINLAVLDDLAAMPLPKRSKSKAKRR